MEEPPLHHLPEVLLLVELPLLRRKLRRRLRVRNPGIHKMDDSVANNFIEKEESDEDMGFGLFD